MSERNIAPCPNRIRDISVLSELKGRWQTDWLKLTITQSKPSASIVGTYADPRILQLQPWNQLNSGFYPGDFPNLREEGFFQSNFRGWSAVCESPCSINACMERRCGCLVGCITLNDGELEE